MNYFKDLFTIKTIRTLLGFRSSKELEELKYFSTVNPSLSSIESYINSSYVFNIEGHYHLHYREWRTIRIKKILNIFGIDWKGKRVLELGGGFGDIGALLAELGAEVINLEARKDNVIFSNLKYHNLKNFKSIQFDLRNDFTKFGKFDLIINFGLIEILDSIETMEHIFNYCIKMSDNILIETMVCDSLDPFYYKLTKSNKNITDNGLTNNGISPSPFYIERLLKDKGFEVIRYFDSDLNTVISSNHKYDWEHKNNNSSTHGLRRFWHFKKDIRRTIAKIKTRNL